VLDLSYLSDLSEQEAVVLYESDSQVGEYICLSHCWGGSQPVRTTLATIAEFRKGIALSQLPKTFRDAIDVTKYLGVRYLWIDSLCIIQDDRRDWEVQAAQMAEIYGRAYLTVAGTVAMNADAGLFSPNRHMQVTINRLDNPIPGIPSLSYREAITHTQLRMSTMNAANESYNEKIEDEAAEWTSMPHPLLGRSWTYQEHLLSPRIIQFTHHEIVWECSCEIWCCCTTKGHHWRGQKHFAAPLLAPYHVLPDSLQDRPDLSTLYEVWRDIVVRYTSKDLAFDNDRLPALSGVAKRAQLILGSTYLAGIWSGDLLHGLCWYTANQYTRRGMYDMFIQRGGYFVDESGSSGDSLAKARRPNGYRAPTWSWASVEGPIEWANTDMRPGNFIVRDYRCVSSSKDPTGCVDSGYLEIECKVVKCLYQGANDNKHHRVGQGNAWEIFDADVPYHVPPYDKELSVGQSVYCVVVGDTSRVYRYDTTATPVLILRKVHSRPKRYERVGLSRGSAMNVLWRNLFETASWRRLVIL